MARFYGFDSCLQDGSYAEALILMGWASALTEEFARNFETILVAVESRRVSKAIKQDVGFKVATRERWHV